MRGKNVNLQFVELRVLESERFDKVDSGMFNLDRHGNLIHALTEGNQNLISR